MLGWSQGRVFGIFGLHSLYVFVPGVISGEGLVQNLRVTLDKGPRSRVQWNRAFLLVKSLKLVARLLDKGSGSRQIKWWFNLHDIILEAFWKETQLVRTKKKLKGELIVWRTKVYARVQGYSFFLLFCSFSFLVEVGLRAQITIWNFIVPLGHRHLHNNLVFLLLLFQSPWIVVTVINYIDNKKNLITICFFGVVISTVGGRGGFIFSCWHNYNKGRFGFILSCCHKYSRWWDLFVFSVTVQWWRGAIVFLTKDEISTF